MEFAFTAPVGVKPSASIALRSSSCRLRTAAAPAAAAPPAVAPVRTTPSAKIFDWKKRADPNYGLLPPREDGNEAVFTVDNLVAAPGSQKRKKRKGRGDATGNGARCGFGMRGQKSRSGRSVRPGFEGGQTPLYRRIPKFVGRPMGPGHKKTEYALIKPTFLNQCAEGSIVSFESLREAGVMTKQKRKIFKVVGGEDVTVQGLTVRAHAFTSSAVEAIEKAQGKCVLISPTTGKDIVFEDDGAEESDVDADDSEVEADDSDVDEASDNSAE